ncbi:protocatechuate 3,4-dioxygenase subunit alpha [Nocardia sp. BMG111209]|uniref:protocatechuate 3,4-dioxygenase subunit alpha n=1 Tax=Nocardia sp. BMG111209 TaxID=1160137 RepID=UPI0003617807|nr:protocatechuate 3,4-dioxygenase subunit alpha [Nocardia sp. BMG111209]
MTEQLPTTPSQTVGPYLHIGLDWDRYGRFVVPEGTAGSFRIHGEVFDGAGQRIPDALIETWQADPDGRFDHPDDPRGRVPGFRGFGRSDTRLGEYSLHTVHPGVVPGPRGAQAPHLDVSVFARGMLHRVVTRLYFPENEAANAADPVLSSVPVHRRSTLIATAEPGGYRFDVHLQGDGETVFFDV